MVGSVANRRAALHALWRLRWLLLGAALAVVVAVQLVAGGLPWEVLLACLAVGLGTNALLGRWLRTAAPRSDLPAVGIVLFDIAGLTLLLALSGGPHNPFAFLYLLVVTFGALVLPGRIAVGLVLVGAAAYASLFAIHDAHVHVHDEQALRNHLWGMWLAYFVSGFVMVMAVARLRSALTDAEAKVSEERARRERTERLGSLATLAAGAAHELASPLATIAVVAGDLQGHGDEGVQTDAVLLKRSVERCRDVLRHLTADAGAGMGETARPTSLEGLLSATLARSPERDHVDVQLGTLGGLRLLVPPDLTAQALRRLIDNARRASLPSEHVCIRAEREPGAARVDIVDRGEGMSPEVQARAGEPFFTTRPTGSGMGLGLYFARSVVEHVGGTLSIQSQVGVGTTVTVRLPVAD